MAIPKIKTLIQLQDEVRRLGVRNTLSNIKRSLRITQFPRGFQKAFDKHIASIKPTILSDPTITPATQMAFDSNELKALLDGTDAVIVTIGRDEKDNFKIAFQTMTINKDARPLTITLGEKVLSNFKDADGSTFPLNGFPTP
jgi:hypothetical protein